MVTGRRLLLLVASLAIGVLAFVGAGNHTTATRAAPAASAHYCGPLLSSVTLTSGGGPYAFDCTVTVPAGITLTIQAGVTIDVAGGAALQVAGVLHANGTTGAGVTFTCVTSFCAGGTWTGIQFLGGALSTSSLGYTTITGASSAVYDFPGQTLNNDTLANDLQGVVYDLPHNLTISHTAFNGFTRGVVAVSSSLTLLSDNFTAPSTNTFALSIGSGTLQVQSSTFTGSQVAVTVGAGVHVTITASQFSGDPARSTGISLGSSASLIMGHTGIFGEQMGVSAIQSPAAISIASSSIINGGTGLALDVENGTLQINQSNLYGNSPNIQVTAGQRQFFVDATNDWWSTTAAPVIASTIVDCRSVATLPCVRFQPYLNGPPVVPPGATPTPTPTRTPTVTPTATSNPALGPQLTLNPTSVAAGSGVQVTATGSGFTANEPIGVVFGVSVPGGGTVLEQAPSTAYGNGSFVVQLPPVPANALPGTYVVTATGGNSKRNATATLTVTGAATPTTTSTPTPTATATATLTPTPTATATPTSPVAKSFKIKSAYLWYHAVRMGTSNHVVVQANHHRRYSVSMHVIFPSAGHDLHLTGRTNKLGHWEQTFAVLRGTDSRSSHQVLVIVQLQQGLVSKRVTLNFILVH
jgi:hypothetical protein